MILALIGIMILLTDLVINIMDDTGEISMAFHVFTCLDIILINLAFMLYL